MNRTIHKKISSRETLLNVTNASPTNDRNDFFLQRWERKLSAGLQADYLKPREKAVDRILELAKLM
jgi:hypothetical protein